MRDATTLMSLLLAASACRAAGARAPVLVRAPTRGRAFAPRASPRLALGGADSSSGADVATSPWSLGTASARRDAFDKLDADGDGFISAREVNLAFSRLDR
ncbi:hypothetical protein T492DRAFT_887160 [Pavlovales sp. CCMP2436]|nr:hypothetical protein T492DRAFT_887160 [Pavlovales sp. CCMP2436]